MVNIYYTTVDVKNSFAPIINKDLNALKEHVAELARGEHLFATATDENRAYWKAYYESLSFAKVTVTTEVVIMSV